MSEKIETTLTVGTDRRPIAMIQRDGRSPGIVFLPGFRSDMEGSKATALDALGAARGLMVTRFDYSGHGRSGGDFAQGTLTRWLEEARAVFARTRGEQVLVGSSMGGGLALLLNRALRAEGDSRVKALVLIAPAVDMADAIEAKFSEAEREAMARDGRVLRPSLYSDEPYLYTKALVEDARQYRMLGAAIETGCPVDVLQGGRDPDVPQARVLHFVSHLLSDPVHVTLVPDGDHRLSRPQDLATLTDMVMRAVEG